MIKYKTTDKEQRDGNAIVLGFSYCTIQNIERYLTPSAYTCGVYGWRADFYHFDDFTISTGYDPLRFISKTGYKDIDAYRKKKAEVLTAELLKLESKLENNFYKWQRESGSWHKGKKQIKKIIERITKKASDEAEKVASAFR
jgi:hypothetical protein